MTLHQNGSGSAPPEIFLRNYRVLREAHREHEITGMALARAKKAAKAEGIDLDAFKLLERLSKLDPDKAELQLRHLRDYCAWLEIPIGTQLDIFVERGVAAEPTDGASAEQRTWEAEEAGYTAGKAGKARTDDNPYPAGSEHYARFDAGYLRGQRVIADELGENAKQADARRGRKQGGAKRGRPRSARANGHAGAHP